MRNSLMIKVKDNGESKNIMIEKSISGINSDSFRWVTAASGSEWGHIVAPSNEHLNYRSLVEEYLEQAQSNNNEELVEAIKYVKDAGASEIVYSETLSQDNNSSSAIDENKINQRRKEQYRKEFNVGLLAAIESSDFEFGFETVADDYLREKLEENEIVARDWLNELFNNNFSRPSIMVGILRVLANFNYDEIKPEGITMSIAALSHSNPEVRECGIRSFESWDHKECLPILRNITCKEQWLQDYLDQVIMDLEED